jgi:uncharacterized protein (DUF1697 family)
MDALRKLYENLGFQNTTTYVQSGNVIFQGDEIDCRVLELKITNQIERTFGFDVPVLLFTLEELRYVIEKNPFVKDLSKDPSFLHITFLSSLAGHFEPETWEDKRQDDEELFVSNKVIYLFCPNGYGKTKLTNSFFESRLKVRATTRNWKTTKELFNIAQRII